MSYALSAALQAAVYQHLLADPELSALIGGAIYDEVPVGSTPPTYVSLGDESVRERSDMTGEGAEHRFTVSVISAAAGFRAAKDVAGAVADALQDAGLSVPQGHVVGVRFLRARARRVGTDNLRRIDLTFRARVEVN